MYKAKIANIEKVRHQATGKDFLDVTVEIVEVAEVEGTPTETVVSTQKHAFEPIIAKEELLAEVAKIRDGYALEQKQKADNAEADAINQHVDTLKNDLVGSEVNINETK